MKRRDFLKNGLSAAATLSLAAGRARAVERPNILWITCEDISPYLGCYGCAVAQTPNLDRMAAEGVRYTHAYANAPVCAVSRSALLTGMHSPTLGTHQMRSHVQLPEPIPAYPKIFREAGYYCTNNSKEDYNSNFIRNPAVWDESSATAHYKHRKPGQPFFAVFNITVTHESQLDREAIKKYVDNGQIPQTPRVNPKDIQLPPYHPDLPEIREDWARLHDLITLMDTLVGEKCKELDEAGLAEDTILFFYSDNAGQLSRSKRYLYNVGTQVPLIIRFPKKWQHLAPAPPGSTVDRRVCFVDLPKTALALAGLPVPVLMQGSVFSGPNTEPAPATVHMYRDRMSERYDFSRAVTDGRWYYIRNFMPHRPLGRDTRYGFEVQANWGAWERYYAEGKCDAVQSQFFHPKPVEEFFDTREDPWQVNNLAEQPEHKERLRALADDLDRWMIETRDMGLIPEPMFHELAGPDKACKTLYDYGRSEHYPVARLLSIAKQASLGNAHSVPDYLAWLRDAHPVARYWGAYGLFLARSGTEEVQAGLKNMMAGDAMAANRIMAGQALGVCGKPEEAFQALLKEAGDTEQGYVFLFALNAFQYSHTDDRLTLEDWKRFKEKKSGANTGADTLGFGFAERLIEDALELWPQRRRVD